MGKTDAGGGKSEIESWFDRMFGAQSPTAEMRRNARLFFANMVERLDLVSRKEFNAQQKALQQAMKKLAALEKKLDAGGVKRRPRNARKSQPRGKEKPPA